MTREESAQQFEISRNVSVSFQVGDRIQGWCLGRWRAWGIVTDVFSNGSICVRWCGGAVSAHYPGGLGSFQLLARHIGGKLRRFANVRD